MKFDNVDLVKLYLGDEPDGEKDLGVSLLSMQVSEEVREEVWSACKGLDVLEPVRVTAEIERGLQERGQVHCPARRVRQNPLRSLARAYLPGSPAED
ncbi:hypothetical protein [Pseudomonas paralcaligenes]|uniref:hypothetical protein n=1 Tax=Pseudomonas paralcaligenes TaxID=2772558 RepID=UPI0021CFC002|nr:hypothetical protein [Pseudomonas paralcaligenes]